MAEIVNNPFDYYPMKKAFTLCLLAVIPFLALAYDDYDDYDFYDVSIDGLYYRLYPSTRVAEVIGFAYEDEPWEDYDQKYEIRSLHESDDEYEDYILSIPSYVDYNDIQYSVTSITEWAFESCSFITHIYIPSSVTEIGYGAFVDCYSISSIVIDENNPVYDSRDNCNAIIETWSNKLIVGCKNTIIPNTVTIIDGYSFWGCSDLTSLTIPSSVISIEQMAFSGCSNLYSIIVDEDNPVYDSRDNCNCIIETSSNTLIIGCMNSIIPNSVTKISDYAFYCCYNLYSIDIPNSVTEIGYGAFANCISLTSIKLPSSLTVISDEVFYACSALESISIPYGVSNIGNYAFAECYSLTSIKIPNSVIEIGAEAFRYCANLSSIVIPNSVTVIEYETFAYCYSLTSVELPSNLTVISDEAFYACEALESISIPYGVTYIGYSAFAYCSSLSSIKIPDSVNEIENWAFDGCRSLTSIVIPKSVTSIGSGVFTACSSLSSIKVAEDNPVYDSRDNCNAIIETSSNTLITGCMNSIIPNSVTKIGEYAFYGIGNLNTIDIPDNVTEIGEGAFYYCYDLVSIVIPKSITKIGSYAFYGSYNLSLVISHIVNVFDIYNSVFSWTTYENATLSVPTGTIELYQQAEGWKNFQNISDHIVEKLQLTEDLFNIHLPDEDITYDGFGHGAYIETQPGVGNATFYYLKQGESSPTTDTPSEPGNYSIYLEIAESTLYYGKDRWLVGTFTIYQFSPVEWSTLQSIYSELNGDGWYTPWDLTEGVECVSSLSGLTIEKGHITNLNLSDQNLTGDFPASIIHLSLLKTADLSNNHLSGDIGALMQDYIEPGTSYQTSLEELNISGNQLSGNIGLFVSYFKNLTTLYASNNCLEDVFPMIPKSVTTLKLAGQTISRVVPLHLDEISADSLTSFLPTILLYNHENQTYSNDINLRCTTFDGSWGLTMVFQSGKMSFSNLSTENSYFGQNGDTLNVSVANYYLPSYGSTFYFKFLFDNGDGNFDGKINILDLQSMLNYMFDSYPRYQPYNFTASNLWEDDVINVQDAVCLVNVLLDMDSNSQQSSSNARRTKASVSEYAASVYIEDGQLLINSSVPVSAFDIVVSTKESSNVDAALSQMGFTCSTKQVGNRFHIVGYSLGGATLPVGKNVICNMDESVIVYAMLADENAEEICALLDSSTNGIQSASASDQPTEVYRFPVGSNRVIVINSNRDKSMFQDEK